SFNKSAPPEKARDYYEKFVESLSRHLGKPVPTGVFGAHMQIEAHNNGPVTLFIDTRNKKL
ncbi:MAG: D-aminoacyl-tRNA deacylase, partial [Opitutae bacterium]